MVCGGEPPLGTSLQLLLTGAAPLSGGCLVENGALLETFVEWRKQIRPQTGTRQIVKIDSQTAGNWQQMYERHCLQCLDQLAHPKFVSGSPFSGKFPVIIGIGCHLPNRAAC